MENGHRYDVLVVGAGPVGLATAIALHRRGVSNLLVIDQTQTFRAVGQVIDLLPNGLKALHQIDPQTYGAVRAIEPAALRGPGKGQTPSGPRGFWHHRTLDGDIIRSIPLGDAIWKERHGEKRLSTRWHQLQSVLRAQLPEGCIQTGRRCIGIDQSPDAVVVSCINRELDSNRFAHWRMQTLDDLGPTPGHDVEIAAPEESEMVYEGKLVVAADGIHSSIRQSLYRDTSLEPWALPAYTGFTAIGCFRNAVPDRLSEALEERYLQGSDVVTVHLAPHETGSAPSPRLMLSRRSDRSIGYLLHTPLPEEALQGLDGSAVIQVARTTLEPWNFPALLLDLIDSSSPDDLLFRAYYEHAADIGNPEACIWSRGRVVLTGDAAHGMPPFTAQGGNQGFEDAALLGPLIAELLHGDGTEDLQRITETFATYERHRRPFLVRLQEATRLSHQWSQTQWEDYCRWVYDREPLTPSRVRGGA